ncbi:MAG: response regulator [Pseudobdellovibrionaceae bacterium]|nr:MAG: response regulator [Pseudobdellovibrionaceae bacterium]
MVYVIEDESDIAELIRFNLSLEGFRVQTFGSGEEGLMAVENDPPDLLVLDLMLPGIGGFDICRRLKDRPNTKDLPIIMVTAKGEETDVIRGLELGASDYITKPFSPKVLVARVKANLRDFTTQNANAQTSIVERHGIKIHPGRHEVVYGGSPVQLTHSEFQILHFLMKKPGWVFTRGQIVDAIRGENYAVTDRSIDFQMVGLRKKLGDAGDHIETVRGVGYRFSE